MNQDNGIKKLLSKIKVEYLIVGIIAIVCLLVISGSFINGKDADKSDSINEYVETLEEKLKNNLSLVNGAGKVSVIISVESGMQTILATVKTKDEKTTTEAPFTVGGKTVALTETYPKISGVIIVAEGANNLQVRVSLINATSVFLNIESDKIQILTRKR